MLVTDVKRGGKRKRDEKGGIREVGLNGENGN